MSESFRMFPEAASQGATQVDYVTWALLGITTFFSGGIAAAIFFFVAKYWHTREVNRTSTSSHLMHWVIELTWSIGPLIILLAMFTWGTAVYVNEHRPPQDCIDIYVVAKQWMWKIAYQNGRREINSLHIPIGRPVRLTMISEDVIHSFFVPAFRIKRDVLPGRYSTMWFEPSKLGVYHLFCAEFCGTEHSKMIGEVVVQTPEEYALWLADEHTDSLAERGRRQFTSLGCLQCHSRAEGPQAGPPLTGLYGRKVSLSGGQSTVADDAYIRRSIVDPKSDVRAGYAPFMPSYDGKIEPGQIIELTAYIRSIANASGPLAGPGIESSAPSINEQGAAKRAPSKASPRSP